jgi:hypothetical protein
MTREARQQQKAIRRAMKVLREGVEGAGPVALLELEAMGPVAIDPILEAMTGVQSLDVMGAAVGVLGRLGDPRAVGPIIEMVGEHGGLKETGSRAVRALGVTQAELEALDVPGARWQQTQGVRRILEQWREEGAAEHAAASPAPPQSGVPTAAAGTVEYPVPVSDLRAILLVVVGASSLGPPPEDLVLETVTNWNRRLAEGISAQRPAVRFGVGVAATVEEGTGNLTELLEGQLSDCDLVIQLAQFQATTEAGAGAGQMLLGTFFRTPPGQANRRITNGAYDELTLVPASA